MNKAPVNYLLTMALGAILWIIFAVFAMDYLSNGPSLAEKDPADFAGQLRVLFAAGMLLSVISACYWYYYGDLPQTASNLGDARKKWWMLFILMVVLSVVLMLVVVFQNSGEGIEPKWYAIYYGVFALLTFVLYWLATYLMSPRTVKFIPLGK